MSPPPCRLLLVALLAAGACRASEVQLVPLDVASARTGVLDPTGMTVSVGMGESACQLDTYGDGGLSAELHLGYTPDVLDLCEGGLLAAHEGALLRIEGFAHTEQLTERGTVDAACATDGWVALDEDCRLFGPTGDDVEVECGAQLVSRADGPWLVTTEGWTPLDGDAEPLEVDALWVDPRFDLRVTAVGRVVTATRHDAAVWETRLPERITGLAGAPYGVYARGETGRLWALDRDGVLLATSSDRVARGELSSDVGGSVLLVNGDRGITAYRTAIGSVAPQD